MDHTEGHLDCPACRKKAYVAKSRLEPSLCYAEASKQWIESREFNAGSLGRARFVTDRSLGDFRQYNRPLLRFFRALPLQQIHLGHIRQYQEDRAAGLLGPTREELFPRLAKRLGRKLRVSVADVEANPQMLAIVNAQLDAWPQREVSPNKINQEVGMLIRVLKRAAVWSQECEEEYEPLQHQESDIPRALTPQEQERFLEVALQMYEFIGCYSILGIHCTLATREERSLKLGDINLHQRVIVVRTASAKNKYRSRTIPLTESALWAAERLIERANLLGSTQPQHCLFPFRLVRNSFDPNRPMTVSGIKKPWDEVRRAAGVPWFTPYGLRHTGCTRYAEDGVSIHTLLAMAGHMGRRTQQHYIHISEQAKRHTIERTYGAGAAPRTVKIPVRSEQSGYLGIHPGKKIR
jgi:site-specific recombinase XerD